MQQACLVATVFAEASGTAFTVAMALMAAVSAFGTSLLAYLAGRDKLIFDKEVGLLRAAVKQCEADREANRLAAEASARQADAAEVKAARMEGVIAAAERDILQLRAEVRELRRMVYGKEGGDG